MSSCFVFLLLLKMWPCFICCRSVGVQLVGRMLAALGAVTRRTQRKGQSERMHHSCKYIYFGCLGLCSSISYVVHWALSMHWLASIDHFVGWPTERQKGEGLNRRITRQRVAAESSLCYRCLRLFWPELYSLLQERNAGVHYVCDLSRCFLFCIWAHLGLGLIT